MLFISLSLYTCVRAHTNTHTLPIPEYITQRAKAYSLDATKLSFQPEAQCDWWFCPSGGTHTSSRSQAPWEFWSWTPSQDMHPLTGQQQSWPPSWPLHTFTTIHDFVSHWTSYHAAHHVGAQYIYIYIYIYKITCWNNNVANQIQDSWTCSFTRRMEHPKEVVFPSAQEDCRNWVHPFTAPTVTVTAWIPLRWPSGKESACQCRRCGFSPWIGKILWRRKLQPTPVFLPWKSHGQRSLVGYRPWSHKE